MEQLLADLVDYAKELGPAVCEEQYGLRAMAKDERKGGKDAGPIKVMNIVGDVAKNKQLDTAKAYFRLAVPYRGGDSVEVDLLPTIGEEVYDADATNRVPSRDQRGTPEQDTLRRDLTIGAMLIRVRKAAARLPDGQPKLEWQLLDYYGGLKDLRQGVLRSPYPADGPTAFEPQHAALSGSLRIEPPDMQQAVWWTKILVDDPLRILRAMRFAATMKFELHHTFFMVVPFALDALKQKVAGSRKLTEIMKIAKVGNMELLEFFRLCFDARFLIGPASPDASPGGTGCLAPGIFGGCDGDGSSQYMPPLRSFDSVKFQAVLASAGGLPDPSGPAGASERCVIRDSNSGHQLLLPPANWCPIFAFWTTQGRLLPGLGCLLLRLRRPCRLAAPSRGRGCPCRRWALQCPQMLRDGLQRLVRRLGSAGCRRPAAAGSRAVGPADPAAAVARCRARAHLRCPAPAATRARDSPSGLRLDGGQGAGSYGRARRAGFVRVVLPGLGSAPLLERP